MFLGCQPESAVRPEPVGGAVSVRRVCGGHCPEPADQSLLFKQCPATAALPTLRRCGMSVTAAVKSFQFGQFLFSICVTDGCIKKNLTDFNIENIFIVQKGYSSSR
jgi:hypothetical protein